MGQCQIKIFAGILGVGNQVETKLVLKMEPKWEPNRLLSGFYSGLRGSADPLINRPPYLLPGHKDALTVVVTG